MFAYIVFLFFGGLIIGALYQLSLDYEQKYFESHTTLKYGPRWPNGNWGHGYYTSISGSDIQEAGIRTDLTMYLLFFFSYIGGEIYIDDGIGSDWGNGCFFTFIILFVGGNILCLLLKGIGSLFSNNYSAVTEDTNCNIVKPSREIIWIEKGDRTFNWAERRCQYTMDDGEQCKKFRPIEAKEDRIYCYSHRNK